MKTHLKAFFLIAFGVTITVLLYEGMSLLLFQTDLKSGEYGVPKGSFTYKLAEETSFYSKSMMNAITGRFNTLKDKIVLTGIYTIIGCCILLDLLRLFFHKVSSKTINFYTCTCFNINHVQVALSNIFVFLFTVFYLSEYIEKYLEISEYGWISTIGIYFILYSVICPAITFTLLVLLKYFGAQFILAIYISIILKNFYEIFIEDDVSPTLMQLAAGSFSKPVQKRLKETHLEDKVFLDTDMSKETNAALVGIEKDARIEIYGEFDKLPEEQKDSVLLHEIGHAIDHSLLKKLLIYFGIYYVELVIMLYLYGKASKHFECEKISRHSAFILLSIVYFLSMKDWMMIFYKMSSQRAEIAADYLAKESGYGEELALSLFTISVTESSYIRPTWLYNALYAMHPSIYDRVEYLFK